MIDSIPYADIRYNGGFIDYPNCVYKVSGEDASDFLQRQTTNNIQKLENGKFQYNSLVDHTGKLSSYFLLAQINDASYMIFLLHDQKEVFTERFNRFLVSEDVELKEQEGQEYFLSLKSENEIFSGELNHLPVYLTDTRPSEQKKMELSEFQNFCNVYAIAFNNVNLGDLVNNTLLEGLCIDYQKGCYPGQETVAKIKTRRGAAFAPMYLCAQEELKEEEISKIGKLQSTIRLGPEIIYLVLAKREYQVSGKKLELENKTVFLKSSPLFKADKLSLAEAFYDQAMNYFHEGKVDHSKEFFEKAIEINPLYEDAYEMLGVVLGREERYQEAIDKFEKLKEVNPEAMMAYTNLSLYHMKLGNIETAENYKSQGTVLSFKLHGKEATAKREKEKQELAEKAELDRREKMFFEVLELDENDCMALNGLGEIFYKKENFEKAAEYFSKAIEHNSNYSVAYLGLAETQMKLKLERSIIIETLEQGISVSSKQGELMPANKMQSLLNGLN